jgi:enhancing lycopene biosynthesis protein 2
VYDGSEVTETVSTLIALDELGVQTVCMAPNSDQHHVIDHTKGEEMGPPRNILVEAARIARGDITDLAEVQVDDLDGVVIPGGFGGAKNLCSWAVDGPAATVQPDVATFLKAMVAAEKPIAALCITPVVLAKLFEGRGLTLSLGNPEGNSPYNIQEFHDGIASLGATPVSCELTDAVVDAKNRIVTSPCYMMEASPSQILAGARKACTALLELC